VKDSHFLPRRKSADPPSLAARAMARLSSGPPKRSCAKAGAIQPFLYAVVDCFAEPVIGPATSGRTRWLAMTESLTAASIQSNPIAL
jgi:hypothetical protein